MFVRPCLVISLVLIIFSCDFEPEGTVFAEISSPNTSDLSIEIPLNTTDTIFLFKPTQISYRSILGTHNAKLIRVLLNGEKILTSANPSGLFDFHTPNYPTGIYKLTIELYATGGSGSLADTEGKEEVSVKREYTLNIDRAAPNQISFTTLGLENGSLKVSWVKYTRRNFQYYHVYKYCYNTFGKQYEPCWSKQLGDQEITSLVDSSFIGGKVKFRIAVHGADQTSAFAEKEFEAAYDLKLTWQWLDNDQLKLTWTKPPCYSSFTSYQLTYGPADDKEVIKVEKVLDTTLVINPQLKFGGYLNFTLAANPYRINSYNLDYVWSQAAVYRGTKFPSIQNANLAYNPVLGKYFIVRPKGYNKYELVRVNIDNSEEQKQDIPKQAVSLSENGAHLYLVEGSILKKIDPLTFTTINTFDLTTLEKTWADWTFNISDNNILAATNYGGTYIVDMSNFQVTQKLPYDFSTILSPDAKFLLRRGEILEFEGGEYVKKMSIPESFSADRQFISDNRLLLPLGGTLLVIDLQTFSIVNKILVEGAYQRYDPVSGMASSISTQFDFGPKRIFLYTLDKKEAVKAIEITGNVRLVNNSLVADGLITPLSSYYP